MLFVNAVVKYIIAFSLGSQLSGKCHRSHWMWNTQNKQHPLLGIKGK